MAVCKLPTFWCVFTSRVVSCVLRSLWGRSTCAFDCIGKAPVGLCGFISRVNALLGAGFGALPQLDLQFDCQQFLYVPFIQLKLRVWGEI